MTLQSHAGESFEATALTASEVRALVDACGTRASNGIRLRALVGVLYGSGLRLSEAIGQPDDPRWGLRVSDYDPIERTVYVRRGKGAKDGKPKARRVAITREGANLLDAWIVERKRLGINGHALIFCQYSKGHKGDRLSHIQARATVARLGRKTLGEDRRVHPHGLRHSLAFAMANAGVPTHAIQAQLGHESLETTGRYVAHLAPTHLVAALDSLPDF